VEVAIGHEAIDGWLNTWKRLIISKGVDGTRGLRAWEEIIASRRLRLWRIPIKQVLAPFELWVPVILRPELDFRLIENALDIAKPDVVVITSDAPYYNIRLFTQVRWAIKQRLSALGGDFSPENVPIVISNTVGPESETVRNLMTLQRAMPYTEKAVGAERGREPSWDKEWRLWEQDYPMAFPDAGADTYLSASEKTLGVLEAIRVWEDAKRSDEIPLGLNVCLHDVPGATCRLALGLAGMRPVFSRNAEYPLLSLQYTFAKSVSERTFTGSFLARLIRNPRNRNTYIELSDKPVIAAIYNFLEPLQGVDLSLSRKPHKKYVPHYLEDEDIKSQVRRVNGGRTLYVLRDVRKIFLTLNQDRELANDLPLKYDDTDSRLWKNYAELAKRGNLDCCPGRLECPIYSYMTTLEVDAFYDKTRGVVCAGSDIPIEGRYIEHAYFASSPGCAPECEVKNLFGRAKTYNDFALVHFCGREAGRPGSFGKLLAHLLFADAKLIDGQPPQTAGALNPAPLTVPPQFFVDMAYLRDFQCLNKTCSFTEVFGRLKLGKPDELGSNPMNALMVVIINEKNRRYGESAIPTNGHPFYYYINSLASYLTDLYEARGSSFYKYFASLNTSPYGHWDHHHLLLLEGPPGLTHKELKVLPAGFAEEKCGNCGASSNTCYIKRRLVESRRGIKKGEKRRALTFTPV
jgi:hypothetical protein